MVVVIPIGDLWDLLADLLNIYELVEEIRAWIAVFGWGVNALLDLFLHAAWSGVASLVGLWLAYWAARGLYFVLGGRLDSEAGLSFALTRRVVGLCILAQFGMDILGHAYAVFRQDLPVTLGNLGKHAARDFHAELWVLALVICLVFGVCLVIRLVDALKHSGKEKLLDAAMRRFSYAIAMLASLSSHMWWDRLLSF